MIQLRNLRNIQRTIDRGSIKIGSEIGNLYSYIQQVGKDLLKEKNKTKLFAKKLQEALKELEEE